MKFCHDRPINVIISLLSKQKGIDHGYETYYFIFCSFFNQEENIPYVSIRVAGTLDRKQKEEICAGVTDVIARVAAKPKESILIFIDEVERDNIASGGKLLSPPQATD